MTQGCNNIVISWLYRTCWNNLATSLIISTKLLQVVNSLFQTCWQLGTSSAKTTCWRLFSRLATRCEIFSCVASLPTRRQQIVFAVFVANCSNKFGTELLTTCNNLVDIIRLVARLFQQVQYSHDITILLQPSPCVVNLVRFLLNHDCIRRVRTTVTSPTMPSSLLQVVNSLFQTCYNN
jgi:hypothetical protein